MLGIVRTYLGGQQISIVIGTSHVDWIAIGIVASENGAGHNAASARGYPGLWHNQHLVGLQTLLGTAVRYVKAAVRGMHLAGRQAAREVAATHVERFPVGGTTHAQCMRWHTTVAGAHPVVVVTRQYFHVVLVDLLATPGDIGLLLARYHLGGQHVAVVNGTTHVDGIVVRVVASYDGHGGQRTVHVGGYPVLLYGKGGQSS